MSTTAFTVCFMIWMMFAVIGIPLMFVASRMPVRFWKRIAWPALIGAVLFQLLVFVPGLGVEANGNRNWVQIAGLQFQPAEFLKITLALWIGYVLFRKQTLLGLWRHVFIPLVPMSILVIATVMAGHDMGTAMILALVVLVLLLLLLVLLLLGRWIRTAQRLDDRVGVARPIVVLAQLDRIRQLLGRRDDDRIGVARVAEVEGQPAGRRDQQRERDVHERREGERRGEPAGRTQPPFKSCGSAGGEHGSQPLIITGASRRATQRPLRRRASRRGPTIPPAFRPSVDLVPWLASPSDTRPPARCHEVPPGP